MIIAINIIIIFLVGFILVRKIDVVEYNPSSKVLIPFYKISISIVERIFKRKAGMIKHYFLNPQVLDSLRQINPTDRSYKHIKKYYIEKLSLSFLVIFVGSIVSIIAILSQSNVHTIIEDKYIERGSYIGSQQSEKLKISIDNKIENQEIEIKIDERQLTEAEVFELFRQVENEIDAQILGKNSSLLEVRSNLRLPTTIEGKPIEIVWDTDNYEILGSDGEVNNEELSNNEEIVNLTATLKYKSYSESYDIKVKILPPIWTESEIIIKSILDKVQLANEGSITDKYMELPQSIDGKQINWGEIKSDSGRMVLLLGVFAAIIIYFGKDNELQKQIKKREQQLLSDYPDIVSKLTLLLGAGMTIKGAWQKIALDYREKKEAEPKYYRYSYEEMLITYYEIIGGVSELQAYEDFGKRSKNQRYMKLSALITQNLRKGSRGLSQILESESSDAFEDRKAFAKTFGEEAGTKLMVPMFLNLILVIVMIMLPACMSFQM